MKGLHLGFFRSMGWQNIAINNNLTSVNYAPAPTEFSFNGYWNPSVWVTGAVSRKSGQFDCPFTGGNYCNSDFYSATLTGVAALKDGQTIQGYFEGNNNTPFATMNLNGLGARTIVTYYGNSAGAYAGQYIISSQLIRSLSLWTLVLPPDQSHGTLRLRPASA